MRYWRTATNLDVCGLGPIDQKCKIGKGSPVQVIQIGHTSRIRCQDHAVGPVDWAQIERHAIAVQDIEVDDSASGHSRSASGFSRLSSKKLPFDRKAGRAFDQPFIRQDAFEKWQAASAALRQAVE